MSLRHAFLATALAAAATVMAAETEQADTLMSLREVTVTAIKGGAMANADQAVTDIGRRAIERLGIVNLKQTALIAPNFYIPDYGSRMTSTIYVRGLGARIDQPVVGLNVDNVPIVNKDNFDFDLADIDRVEILRGPQNILYGRNTMAGLINIYTLSPLSYEGVRLSARYGTHNTFSASAALYRRLAPGLGMSLSAQCSGTDGYYRNAYNDTPVGRQRDWNVRWKTAWRPAPNVIFENAATLSGTRQNGYAYAPAGTKVVNYNDTCFYRRLSFTDGLTVKHSFGGIDFSSIISFQYLNDNMTLDQDFLPVDYFTLSQMRHEWALTADFVARGHSGSWHWLAGLYGYGRRGEMNAPVCFGDYGISQLIERHANTMAQDYPLRWDERSLLLGSRFTLPSGGASAYHQSEFRLGDWSLTAGLRFDWEHVGIDYHSHANTSYTIYQGDPSLDIPYLQVPLVIDERGSLSRDFCQLLPKVSVSYRLPGSTGNIFISATRGYKPGGYNTQMFSDVLQQKLMAQLGVSMKYDVDEIISYDPEKNWNFEGGAHLFMLDNRLQASATLFWIECTDQQITMFPDGSTTGRIMANAGKTRSRGVEISAAYDSGSGLTLRGSYGLTDARFRRFDNGRLDFSGNRVPYAPQNTMFAGAGWNRPVTGAGPLHGYGLELNARGVGRIWWDEANTVSQPFYVTLSARARALIDRFTVELWADNITGTQYDTFYFVSIGNPFLQRGPKFTIGATLKWDFGF